MTELDAVWPVITKSGKAPTKPSPLRSMPKLVSGTRAAVEFKANTLPEDR